jgi:hypothetical protein
VFGAQDLSQISAAAKMRVLLIDGEEEDPEGPGRLLRALA